MSSGSPVPAPPPQAAEVFGRRLPLAVRYAGLLCGPAVERGLVGPREAARVWPRHLLNSAALARLIDTGARVVDVGSGAGLPGIPLAIARPDLRVVLLEPMLRRVAFLHECVAELGLDVAVERGRAEDGRPDAAVADVVVARAVAPLDRLLALARPLLRPGGELLALKGREVATDVARARPVLRRHGYAAPDVVSVDAGGEPAVVVRVRASERPVAAVRGR